MTHNFFAGFIITYERPHIVVDTINKIFSQTLPPEKLLVIDNSASKQTEQAIKNLQDIRIEYLFMGYNSGPAGAAKVGLQRLISDGYQWIYWGDDNDPPDFSDTFEQLIGFADRHNQELNIGIIGCVGHYFNTKKGEIKRVSDQELKGNIYLNVDSIAGGQSMIVSRKVVEAGVLPNEDLFFGFEELDFCLSVKRCGFTSIVLVDLYRKAREKYGRFNYQQPVYTVKSRTSLRREYYSARNLLLILREAKLYRAFYYQLLKQSAKMIYGFKFGIDYGWANFKFIGAGIFDALRHRGGKRF